MTDKQFEKLLFKVTAAHSGYLKLLNKAEDEYKRRFGKYPSEVDDDHWIDSFHVTGNGSNLENVIKHAKKP